MRNDVIIAVRNLLLADSDVTSRLATAQSIYHGVPPIHAARPYILLSATPITADNRSPRPVYDVTLTVNVTADTVYEATEIYKFVRPALNDKTISITGYGSFWCRENSSISYDERFPTGKRFAHVAGDYSILLST